MWFPHVLLVPLALPDLLMLMLMLIAILMLALHAADAPAAKAAATPVLGTDLGSQQPCSQSLVSRAPQGVGARGQQGNKGGAGCLTGWATGGRGGRLQGECTVQSRLELPESSSETRGYCIKSLVVRGLTGGGKGIVCMSSTFPTHPSCRLQHQANPTDQHPSTSTFAPCSR